MSLIKHNIRILAHKKYPCSYIRDRLWQPCDCFIKVFLRLCLRWKVRNSTRLAGIQSDNQGHFSSEECLHHCAHERTYTMLCSIIVLRSIWLIDNIVSLVHKAPEPVHCCSLTLRDLAVWHFYHDISQRKRRFHYHSNFHNYSLSSATSVVGSLLSYLLNQISVL